MIRPPKPDEMLYIGTPESGIYLPPEGAFYIAIDHLQPILEEVRDQSVWAGIVVCANTDLGPFAIFDWMTEQPDCSGGVLSGIYQALGGPYFAGMSNDNSYIRVAERDILTLIKVVERSEKGNFTESTYADEPGVNRRALLSKAEQALTALPDGVSPAVDIPRGLLQSTPAGMEESQHCPVEESGVYLIGETADDCAKLEAYDWYRGGWAK